MMQNASVLCSLTCKCAWRDSAGCHFSTIFRHRHVKKWPEHLMFLTFWLANVLLATAGCKFSTAQRPKCSDNELFCAFWVANVLLATAACNFWTSELQKCAKTVSFLAFWLWNALRATAVCHFSTSQLPKVLEAEVLYTFLLDMCFAPQWRAIFFLSALSSYLRTRRFSEPTFRPSRHTNPRKNTAFHDFPNISRRCMFFLVIFAQLYLLSFLLTLLLFSAFHLLTLLLCSAFSTFHIVGS